MKKIALCLCAAIMASVTLGSCSLVLGDDPDDDPLSVYDSFWSVLNRDYAGFYTKTEVDWEALRLQHRETVLQNPREETLLLAFGDIITRLNDGHMILFAGDNELSVIPAYNLIPFDFTVIRDTYLSDGRPDGSGYIYTGFLEDGIAYMWVSAFSGSGWSGHFSTELDRLSPSDKLIIDLRNNGGGNSSNGEDLLAQFIAESALYGRDILPVGPDDPPVKRDLWVHPAKGAPRNHSIVILINEGSSSTTDMVIAGFQEFTEAFTIGKPSRAELVGNNVPRELVNGWVFRLGTINNLMIRDTIVDGDMLPVDLDIDNSLARLQEGTDDQLDAAIAWFGGQ